MSVAPHLSLPPLSLSPQLALSFPQEAGELYNRMLKRFRQEKAVWIKYGAFLLRRGQAGASHRVMQRALECLPKKERECSSLPACPPSSRAQWALPHLGRGVGSSHPRGGKGKSCGGYVAVSIDYTLMSRACVAFQKLNSKDRGTESHWH